MKPKKRVLLVDDHDLFRQVLAVVLEHHAGFGESAQAGSTAEARRALLDGSQVEADLAFVDLDLPDTADAAALIGELRGVGVPVVAMTASRDQERHARALEAGACEVLTTAATSEEIVGAARRLGG